MIPDKIVAGAVGGKTARACDNCIRKRARWFCAADDAFLCQDCDASVHSANPLARRHERVRLKTASFKPADKARAHNNYLPTWHKGFTRKARTPRHGKTSIHRQIKSEGRIPNPLPLVPELGSDDTSHDENEEQLLYRVPTYDPFVAELCTSAPAVANESETADGAGSESKASLPCYGEDVDNLHGILPSDMDLAEFAADVESLLGRGLEHESFGMEELGLLDCKEKDSMECSFTVKVKDEDDGEDVQRSHVYADVDMAREPFELSFDYESPTTCGDEEEKTAANNFEEREAGDDVKKKKKILLRLDYEAVITAWATQGSPWTTGDRPVIDTDDCWSDCMDTWGTEVHQPYGEYSGGLGGQGGVMGDGGREARVSRYREKRRTRLFSKKIRYEVRKLNAEKRPRMKGRFVKRSSFVGPAAGFPLLGK